MAAGDCYFGAWPVDRIETEDEYSACSKFLFLIQAVFSRPDEDGVVLRRDVCLEYDVVMHDEERSKDAIHHMLSNIIGVPVLPFMVHKVLDVAHSMSANKHYAGRKVLRIFVDAYVSAHDDDDDDDDDMAELGGEDDWEPKFEPASRVSIQELERVNVEGGLNEEEAGCCSVCFDDFETGCEATRLPCSHLFHGDCIVKWLQNSKFCPLCRFQMPSL